MSKETEKKLILDEGSLLFPKPITSEKKFLKRLTQLTNQHLLDENGEITSTGTQQTQSLNDFK